MEKIQEFVSTISMMIMLLCQVKMLHNFDKYSKEIAEEKNVKLYATVVITAVCYSVITIVFLTI